MLRAIWVGILLAIAPPVNASADSEAPSHIPARELLAQIEAGTAPPIIDVRSRSEYERGHVPGAIHLPFWAAMARSDEIPAAPEEPIVLYCEHGPRAGLAKAGLRLAGFEQITYLTGHMTAWKEAGLPLEESPGTPTGEPPASE